MSDTPPTVTGTEVAPPAVTVKPDAAAQQAQAERARGRTSIQSGIPAALIIILAWTARLFDVDLSPDVAGNEAPAEVVAAVGYLLTQLLAAKMNPLRALRNGGRVTDADLEDARAILAKYDADRGTR